MGKFLQIRVAAWTYDEAEVEQAWPKLWNLVWGEDGDAVSSKGVLELGHALFNAVQAGLLTNEQAHVLAEKVESVENLCLALQDALANRDPQKADKLTYQIEDMLDVLEGIADNF